MRNTNKDKEKDLGFQLHRQRSRRYFAIIFSDLDFANKLASLTEKIEKADWIIAFFLLCQESRNPGLQSKQPMNFKTRTSELLKEVNYFKHFGASNKHSETDFELRKAVAWSARFIFFYLFITLFKGAL